jgi:hypothetical protein
MQLCAQLYQPLIFGVFAIKGRIINKSGLANKSTYLNKCVSFDKFLMAEVRVF